MTLNWAERLDGARVVDVDANTYGSGKLKAAQKPGPKPKHG
jgi:hypothetical protein